MKRRSGDVWRSLPHKSTYSTVSDEEQMGAIDPKLAFSLHTAVASHRQV
jgi:hypothetical protein